MAIKVTKRKLTDQEIELLINQIKEFPNLVAGNKQRWQKLDLIYAASTNKTLVGICSVTKFRKWLKIGPFVVLKEHQSKGYGKLIIQKIVDDYATTNLFTVSRNPAVWKIAKNFKFHEVSLWRLPVDTKIYLFVNTLKLLSIDNIQEQLKKRSFQKNPHSYFLKEDNNK